MQSFIKVWNYFKNLGVHSGLSLRDIRITRTINQFIFCLLFLIIMTAVVSSCRYLHLEGRILPQTFLMLLNFLPLGIVFYLNKKEKYFAGRLFFIVLPLLTSVLWMFAQSSQDAAIHYVSLLYPIPIVILFKNWKTQLTLVLMCISCYLISNYIISNAPVIDTGIDATFFKNVIPVIWIMLAFIMLRFFVKEIELTEKKLREKNKELEEFSRLASHDMREPLRTIGGFSSLIKTKYGPQLDENGVSYLEHINDGIERMDNLLKDLSDYSMIDKSPDSLVSIDLNSVLSDVKSDLTNQIENVKAVITNDRLPKIQAKASHMRQLFQNLISNSLKFQPKKEEHIPKISINTIEDNDYNIIKLRDNGIGIKKEYLNEIFLKFKRLHSRDKYEGTGLGLATCKRIVEYYKGDIEINSEEGRGTTITIKLMK